MSIHKLQMKHNNTTLPKETHNIPQELSTHFILPYAPSACFGINMTFSKLSIMCTYKSMIEHYKTFLDNEKLMMHSSRLAKLMRYLVNNDYEALGQLIQVYGRFCNVFDTAWVSEDCMDVILCNV